VNRRRTSYPRSTNPIYFWAFWLAAAVICIVLPIALTSGR
jgi:hypothetical protein